MIDDGVASGTALTSTRVYDPQYMKKAPTSVADVAEDNAKEEDFARSAWYDGVFAVWFAQFATSAVLFNGARAERFFKECGEFAKKHKIAPGDSGDQPCDILNDASALDWFVSIETEFKPLPGGKKAKPTSWQIEKARGYLRGRHDAMLAEKLMDAEELRKQGDAGRADMIAAQARRVFTTFSDTAVVCSHPFDDADAIVSLAEENPPLFQLRFEIGKLLNNRLKADNFGVILGNQKIGKTTFGVTLAMEAAKQVPTLFIGAGDETKKKIDGRMFTNCSCLVTQAEYAGTTCVPIPDCQHNADGTCPIGKSGEPRQVKSWKVLIDEGNKPKDIIRGTANGSLTVSGNVYHPCARCFPMHDGTREDIERVKNWKSAVWWREHDFRLCRKKDVVDQRIRFQMDYPQGYIETVSYPTGTLTVDEIYRLLDQLDRTKNFVPSVIVLDYIDIMKQTDRQATDKDHDGFRMLYEKLRALNASLHNLIITFTQTNRLGHNLETHTIDSIGRCAKGMDNSTWFLTLNQTVAERRARVMRASVLAAREGDFDPEQQTLCYTWPQVQDSLVFSAPVFCKIKQPYGGKEN